jgi:hypothetical protein
MWKLLGRKLSGVSSSHTPQIAAFSTIMAGFSFPGTIGQLQEAIGPLLTRNLPRQKGKTFETLLSVLHEATHYWQCIGTTYGFHYMRCIMAQSKLVKAILQNLQEQGVTRIQIPLKNLDLSRLSEATQRNIRELMKMWWALEYYKNALHEFALGI